MGITRRQIKQAIRSVAGVSGAEWGRLMAYVVKCMSEEKLEILDSDDDEDAIYAFVLECERLESM